MRFHQLIIATLALASPLLPTTEAFTNGTMLPSYLCGPAIPLATGALQGADGYPKALAGVLAQMKELTPAVQAADQATYSPTVDPRLWVAVMHAANSQGQIKAFSVVNGNTGTQPFVEAALGTTAAMTQGGIMTAAQTNILHVGKQVTAATAADQTAQAAALGACPIPLENVIPATTTTIITPNQLVTLTLQAQNNVLGVAQGTTALNLTGFANIVNNGVNPPVLDGAIVYAQDANNKRVGHFTTGGNNMAVWTACGADRNGVVHTQLLSPCTNSYTGPQFFLPFDFAWPKLANGQPNPNAGVTTITFMGAAVSDNGFGYHQTKWQVQPLPNFNLIAKNINGIDFLKCVLIAAVQSTACLSSCFDCAMQAGSQPKNATTNNGGVLAANVAQFGCTPVAGTGNPAAGQAAIWSATCKINNKPVTVVPAGTLPVVVKAKDATGSDMVLDSDQQAAMDQFTQLMAGNITQTQTQTCTQANTYSGNQINTAATQACHMTWFTTLVLAVGAWFSGRQ